MDNDDDDGWIMTMDDKKKNKPIKKIAEPPKLKKIGWRDVLFRKLPECRLVYTGEFGIPTLSEVHLRMWCTSDWENLPYFFSHCLPRAMIAFEEPEDKKKKKQDYLG